MQTENQAQALEIKLRLLHNELRRHFGTHKNCVNCEHFVKDVCELAGQTPPPRIIVVGCEHWDEGIPF